MIDAKTLTLEQLLQIEDEPALLDYTCEHTGVPIWALIRTECLWALIDQIHYRQTSGPAPAVRTQRIERARTLGRSLLHNVVRRQLRGSICLMPSGIANTLIDGRWFNRLSGHFANCAAEHTVVVEDQFCWQWRSPKHFEHTLLHAPLAEAARVVGKLRLGSSHKRVASQLVEIVSARARQHFDWEIPKATRDGVAAELAMRVAEAPVLFDIHRALFRRLGTKLLLKEDGCFSSSSVIVRAARSLGVTTAEYQHGIVSPGHYAYNVAPALRRSDQYQQTLPEHFLAYGSWWNEQINVPLAKLAVGNPHQAERIRTVKPKADAQDRVLVLGAGIDTRNYVAFAARIAQALKSRGLRVVLRPHPVERAQLEAIHQSGDQDVEIDPDRDVYESLAGVNAVIAETSTVLFEAVGLAKRIFSWDTDRARFALPVHPFQRFSEVEEVIALLEAADTGSVSAGVDSIWCPEWRDNYLRFLADSGVA